VRGEAEVGPAIIESVAIFVVYNKMPGRVHNHPVHTDHFDFAGTNFDVREGIELLAVGGEIPIEAGQWIVIVRRNKGEKVVAEVNPSERVAVPELAIKNQRPGEDTVEPDRDFDSDSSHNRFLLNKS